MGKVLLLLVHKLVSEAVASKVFTQCFIMLLLEQKSLNILVLILSIKHLLVLMLLQLHLLLLSFHC
jgi:hypothetical protein